MEKNRVELPLTKKGLMITAIVIVVLDLLTTWLVAKANLEIFMLNEINPLLKWCFVQFGWGVFLVYPFIPLAIYYALFSIAFFLMGYYESNKTSAKIFRTSFYFLFSVLIFHIWIVISNLILYIRIENLK